MLSEESKIIYDALCEITGNSDGYKIIEAEEVNEKIPQTLSLSKVQISQIIRDLKDREYIEVKYFTPDEYCLRMTKRVPEPQTRATSQTPVSTDETADEVSVAVEQTPKQRELYDKTPSTNKGGVRYGIVFLMAWLGGLLGSGIVAAIAVVLFKFVL